jgi:hypothetical protein
MAISKRAIDLTDGIYVAYGSGSGYLFGIEPNKKEAVKAIVQVTLDRLENSCPFCGVADFDKPGLKSHLEHGDCEEYNNTEAIKRVF